MSERWTFDELSIGMTDDRNRVDKRNRKVIRVVALRPLGFSESGWQKFASTMCKEMNEQVDYLMEKLSRPTL